MLVVLGNHLWQSTLFGIAAGLLTLVFRKDSARIRHGLWLAASLKFLVPFSVLVILGSRFAPHVAPLAIKTSNETPAWSLFMDQVAQPLSPTVRRTGVASVTSHHATPFFNMTTAAVALWLGGVAIVLCISLLRWRRINTALRTARPFAGELRPGFPIEVKSSAIPMEPGVIGILNPVLLLPEGITEQLPPEQLQAILAHELCHVRRRDNLTGVLHLVVETVFWFYPLVWWLGTRIVEERERACDEAVLESGSDRTAYAEGLLRVCELYLVSPLVCAAGVGGANLKRRVAAIMHSQVAPRLNVAKKGLLAAATAAAMALPVVVGLFRAPDVRAQDTAAAPATGSSASAAATIRLGSPDGVAVVVGINTGNGQLRIRNHPLKAVIAYAYDVPESQVVGPADTLSVLYSMDAQVTSPDHSEKSIKAMLQGVLADRFGLASHWETRRVPVYAVLGGDPAKIKQPVPGDPGSGLGGDSSQLTVQNQPFPLFVEFLGQHFDRPIVDQTGLTARYSFALKWTADPGPIGSDAAEQSMMDDVQKQLGLQFVTQTGDVKFFVIDHVTPPTNLIPLPKRVSVDPGVLDRYVGHYAFPANRVMTVSRDGKRFLIQLNGAPGAESPPPPEFFASGERAFFTKATDDTVTFITGNDGSVTSLILHRNGRDFTAPKISDAAAQAQEEALAVRVREQKAFPGSEAALRKHLQALLTNRPDDDNIEPAMAPMVDTTWADARNAITGAGQLQSVTFKRVGPLGSDVYQVHFEKAKYVMRIAMDSAGKIDGFDIRQLPAT